jgi:hypothetical protein
LDCYKRPLITSAFKIHTRTKRNLRKKPCYGKPGDPRGRVCCFWCANKTWTLVFGAFDTLTIVKNGSKMRKLRPPKKKGVKNSKKKATQHYKRLVPEHPKDSLYVAITVQRWFIEFQVAFLEHFKLFIMNKK